VGPPPQNDNEELALIDVRITVCGKDFWEMSPFAEVPRHQTRKKTRAPSPVIDWVATTPSPSWSPANSPELCKLHRLHRTLRPHTLLVSFVYLLLQASVSRKMLCTAFFWRAVAWTECGGSSMPAFCAAKTKLLLLMGLWWARSNS